jgi:acetyltransferase-like isoleucine patch superfamily enzyme
VTTHNQTTDASSPLVARLAQRLLQHSGRNYAISATIPAGYLLGEIAGRALQALRGVVKFRSVVFVGPRVRVRGKNRLTLARGVYIGDDTIVDARGTRGVSLAPGSRLGRHGIITTTSHLSLMGVGVSIGKRSGIGDFFHIGASGGLHVGEDVIVGPYFLVHSQEHNYLDPEKPIRDQGTTQSEVIIGDNCWIGSRVTLLAGTQLGPRTVVASGAVVRGAHPGNEILAGIPAKPIKQI